MASISEGSSTYEDLTCPLCFEFFADPHTPKELSCPHVYCYLCLKRMVTREQTSIECPECRRITTLPRKGISALKTNMQLRSLAKKHLLSGQSKYSIEKIVHLTCSKCYEFLVEPHTPKKLSCVHVYCRICLKAMVDKKCNIECPICKKNTKVSIPEGIDALKTDLRLRSLAEKHLKSGKKRNETNNDGATCPYHKGESTPFHCSTCSIAICQFCLLNMHRRHDVKEQSKLVQEKKTELENILQAALGEVDRYKAHIAKLMQLEGTLASALKRQEEEIDRCVVKAVQTAQITGKAAKKQLRQTEQQRRLRIRHEVTLVKKKIDEIRTGQSVAQTDIDALTYENYTERYSVLAGKLSKLCIKEQTSGINIDNVNMAKFIPHRKIPIGRVVEPLRLQLVQEFGEFLGANAIGASPTSDDLLIINDFRGGKVHVYGYQPYEYKPRCTLELSQANKYQPRDVAITVLDEYLVARCTGVEVYSTDGKYKKIIPGVNIDDASTHVNIFSVTTTQDGRALVGDSGRKVVTEHRSRTNRVIRTSITPGSVASIGDTHMVVTDKYESGSIGIQSLATGKETLKLDIPGAQGVCYHAKSDCILVVRSETGNEPGQVKIGTGLLEQYCRVSGRLIGCLVRGLFHPRAVVFTSEDMLAISDHKTVKIYRIN